MDSLLPRQAGGTASSNGGDGPRVDPRVQKERKRLQEEGAQHMGQPAE